MLYIILPHCKESDIKVFNMIRITRLEFPESRIVSIHDKECKGKGWAIREGLKKALMYSDSMKDTFAYIDGDGDIHPRMLKRMIPFLDEYAIVVGTKRNVGLLSRRLLTFFSRIYIRVLFGVPVDTQTGIKLFRKNAVLIVSENGFLFDIAMLHKAKKFGFGIVEVPIIANIDKKVKVSTMIGILISSIFLKIRLSLRP